VDGAISGTPGHLIVTASIVAADSGRIVGRSSVEGPLDSLGVLANRVAADLLASQAGERRRLADLSGVPLPALRAYLDGQAALRRGQWDEAVLRFRAALDSDTTFAQAGLGLAEAAAWTATGDDRGGGAAAWAHRDRLSPQDRILLSASMGPRYPYLSTQAEMVDALEQAVRAAPDRPEVWYHLGDLYYHLGANIQMARPLQLAATAFRRAIDLDSSITRAAPGAEPLIHLGQIAAREGDTATLRRLARLARSSDSGGTGLSWRSAWALRDTAALRLIRAGFDTMKPIALEGVVTRSVEDGLPLDDAERAVTAMAAHATTQEEIGRAQFERYLLSMSAGRPTEAARALQSLKPGTRFFHGITGELYWDGDSALARTEAQTGAVRADASLTRVPRELGAQFWDICWVERWRLAHGELGNTRRAIARLRTPVRMGDGGVADSSRTAELGTLCADVLEASLATVKHEPNAPLLVSRLNDRLRAVPPGWTYGDNLAVARLLEAGGNYTDALAAVRRRSFDTVPVYLSTYLREEGRLAALAGDTAGAIRAYRQYLVLMAHPEPAVAPRVERIRAELARLEGQ
jgi:tetratricopeptide (TPR) repeat protein